MKIIISERQQKLIKENSVKGSLIDMIKEDGWKSASELVGGYENLKKLVGIKTPMDFLHLFDDLNVVQSEEDPDYTLFRHEKGINIIAYNGNSNISYIDNYDIWVFLEEGFGLNYTEIQDVIKDWLESTYNLRGTIPVSTASYDFPGWRVPTI